MKYALGALVLVVIALHQDNWFWTDKTLVFGFLPIGLAYHAAYSGIAALVMALLVKYLWPKDLDEDDESQTDAGGAGVPTGVGPIGRSGEGAN